MNQKTGRVSFPHDANSSNIDTNNKTAELGVCELNIGQKLTPALQYALVPVLRVHVSLLPTCLQPTMYVPTKRNIPIFSMEPVTLLVQSSI